MGERSPFLEMTPVEVVCEGAELAFWNAEGTC